MSEHYDAIVIGAGIGGATCAQRLNAGGMRVALVEQGRIGGETAYWTAIPSKTLLGPANPVWRMQVAAGITSPSLAGPVGAAPLAQPAPVDDAAQVAELAHAGIALLRGAATMIGPGKVQVGERVLEARSCVIATGLKPQAPTIEHLMNI